jgi:arylamine N-acetyltransferase
MFADRDAVVEPLPAPLAGAYLRRLGVEAGPPTSGLLRAVHRAQVERVPYENLDIFRGVPPGIDPVASARRIVAGGGGYCYHHNGALSALLARLGFDVSRHVGAVRGSVAADPDVERGNHLTLTVELDGRRWFVDCGLGDLLHEPVPLRPGAFRQGPFRYELLDLGGGAWRLLHDPAQKSFCDMTFDLAPAGIDGFAENHRRLSTAPDSGFVTTFAAFRRMPDSVEGLRGLVRSSRGGAGLVERELTDAVTWFAALADDFGLSPAHMTDDERDAIWRRVATAHRVRRVLRQSPV